MPVLKSSSIMTFSWVCSDLIITGRGDVKIARLAQMLRLLRLLRLLKLLK